MSESLGRQADIPEGSGMSEPTTAAGKALLGACDGFEAECRRLGVWRDTDPEAVIIARVRADIPAIEAEAVAEAERQRNQQERFKWQAKP
jgi:hypothetical protein